MNDFWKHIATVLTGKDGPLIWGITAITALTLGWKFLDKNYEAEGVKYVRLTHVLGTQMTPRT